MAKGKTSVFFCQNCGYESAKWMGQCPACHEWNTFAEEPVQVSRPARGNARAAGVRGSARPLKLTSVDSTQTSRGTTGLAETVRQPGTTGLLGAVRLPGMTELR